MTRELQLIGRENELSRLQEALNAARSGNGRVVLIAGEAGVGKTHIAEACLAGGGVRVFSGRIREESMPPFAPITSVLRDCIRQSKTTPVASLDARLVGYLALILPELGTPAEDADHATLVEAIGSVLAASAKKQPCAVLLDDIQWTDNATMELLPALADRLRNEAVLIVATYRSDEIARGHPIRRLRAELRREKYTVEVSVEPLGREHTRRLIENVLGDVVSESLVGVIHEKTRGLPLYVEELADTLKSGGHLFSGEDGFELTGGSAVPVPDSIRDVVLLKMDGVSDPARAQLELAAVLGMEFDFDAVAQLAGEDGGIQELIDRNFLVEAQPGRGEFRHALTREAVQGDIAWSRRRALNRQVAEYLEMNSGEPEVIADHWLAANEHGRARRSLLQSAERSCRVYAYRDAAGAANRALEIWPQGEDEVERLDALERLAHCAQVSGQLGDSVRALREVIDSPLAAGDHRRLGEALRALATIYGLQGALEQATETRRAAAEAFRKAGDQGEAAGEWLAAARHLTAMLHYSSAVDMARKASKLAGEAKRPDVHARALGLEGNVLAMQGKSKEGREAAKAALSLALEQNDVEAASEVYRRLASALEYSADYAGSRDVYFQAINFCETQGAGAETNLCMSCMSWVLYRTGEWKNANEMCRAVLASKSSPVGSRATASSVLGLIRVHRGEIKQARRNLNESIELARRHDILAVELISTWALALLLEEDGDDDGASTNYIRVLDLRDRCDDRHDALLGLVTASTFFATRTREAEANRCVEALASIASATGNQEALAGLAFALGETALMHGDPREAVSQFERALSLFERLGTPMDQAQTGWRLGAAQVAEGSREEAIRCLTNAYRIARKLGARPLATRISGDLKSIGAPVEEGRGSDPAKRAGTGGLTRRQVEVARLVADGLTNKEIAQKLYLSTRTVDMHVANILDRLDCRSRSEAVRKAGEIGLLDN